VIDDALATELRHEMVETQIADRGVRDPRVLAAMRSVPRHVFAPGVSIAAAYDDCPQRIGRGQTISQPFIVALMTQMLALRGTETVLEVGTGSGYQTAILAELASRVVTVERIPELQERARRALEATGHADRIAFRLGDGGALRHPEGPFDAILVTAAAERLPRALVDQLADGGVLVAPVGPPGAQELVRVHRRGDKLQTTRHGACAFVPLVSQ